jgi:hypothetical protein
LKQRFLSFCKDDAGAVTVDWVILTSVVVLMAGAVAISVTEPTLAVGDAISDSIASHVDG